jgi:hypothetical protein
MHSHHHGDVHGHYNSGGVVFHIFKSVLMGRIIPQIPGDYCLSKKHARSQRQEKAVCLKQTSGGKMA